MTWEPRPLPEVTPETQDFWSATSDGELSLGECNACSSQFHYPRGHCPDCFSDNVEITAAAGTGTIYSHTKMESVPGWPEEALPLRLAMVELDEGPRLLTNLVDSDPDEIRVGAPVEVVFQETEADLAVPTFTVQS